MRLKSIPVNAPATLNRSRCDREDALAVLRRLREAGHVAYFAGGCVRDLLMGISPKDYDVATDAPPQRVRELFANTQAVGAAFGVILVRKGPSQIEVATFRADGPYLDGRHPSSVQFTTADQDARRRDFTINGLFLDPIKDEVIDYVGGQADLKARVLRAIGDPLARFDEDSLRLLRAVRFAARFDLAIDPATAAAIISLAPTLRRVSPERIAEELRLMLTPAASRNRAWEILWSLGLVHEIFRFLPGERNIPAAPGEFLFRLIDPEKPIEFGLALAGAAICYQRQTAPAATDPRTFCSPAAAQAAGTALRQSLKISNDEQELMRDTLSGLAPLLADDEPPLAIRKRFLARPSSNASRRLMAALAQSGIQADRIGRLQKDFAELERTDFAPQPFVTGDDLMRMGLQPGPMFKHIIDLVYDAQLEGRITTKDEAEGLALTEASKGRG